MEVRSARSVFSATGSGVLTTASASPVSEDSMRKDLLKLGSVHVRPPVLVDLHEGTASIAVA